MQSIKDDWKLIHIFTGMRDISGFCMGQVERNFVGGGESSITFDFFIKNPDFKSE